MSLLWLPQRARLGAIVGVIAVAVFAIFSAFGLPINTRYGFLTGAILCVFCGAGVFGWKLLPAGDPRRRRWQIAAAVVAVALVAYTPARSAGCTVTGQIGATENYRKPTRGACGRHAITTRCGPVGVPNHAPIPLLALYLRTSPAVS